jgi:hypothetical protein
MSVAALLNRVTQRPNSVVVREGKDIVVQVTPRALISLGALAVAVAMGAMLAMDTAGVHQLSDKGRMIADTVLGIVLWFPLNHRKAEH